MASSMLPTSLLLAMKLISILLPVAPPKSSTTPAMVLCSTMPTVQMLDSVKAANLPQSKALVLQL
jgi:hypothetical protein